MKTTSYIPILIIFLSLAFIGYALFPSISLNYTPSSKAATLNVSYYWSNASPLEIEQNVSTPLEGMINSIQGVKEIYSVSNNGYGYIEVEVDKGSNPDWLKFEVASRIRQIYNQLPEGVTYPQVSINAASEDHKKSPILVYSISSDEQMTEIYRYAKDKLRPQLSLIAGVQKIAITGATELEYRILYDDKLMQQFQLSERDIIQSLELYFATSQIGSIQDSIYHAHISLKNATGYTQSELLNLPIISSTQRLLYLKDIARIELAQTPPQSHYRINAENSIRISFYAEENQNTLLVADKIKEEVAKVKNSDSNIYSFYLDEDATEYLKTELDKIQNRSLLSLGILLLFVFLINRRWQYILTIIISLFVNIGIAFIFYYLLKVQLHLYALAGITVSFGIIIDNTLVMMYHYAKHKNTKIFAALLAATLTTISALTVIFFLPEKWQINLLDFAKVIAINLLVSLSIALLLVPALIRGFSKPQKPSSEPKPARSLLKLQAIYSGVLSFMLRFRGLVIVFVILLFGLPTFLIPSKVENWDRYNKIVDSDIYIEKIKPIIDKSLGGTFRLFNKYVYEKSSYNEAEETVLYIQGKMPNGATTQQMNSVFENIELFLLQFPEDIKRFTTNIYSGQQGQIKVYFKDNENYNFPFFLRNKAVNHSLSLGGVEWDVYGVGKGFSNSSHNSFTAYSLIMYGYNYFGLIEQADNMKEKLEKHPRVRDVDTDANLSWSEKDLFEYKLAIDQREMAKSNTTLSSVYAKLSNYNNNIYPSYHLPNGNPVRLINATKNKEIWSLSNDEIKIDSSKLKLYNFAQVEKRKVSTSIHKNNQEYIRRLKWSYTGSSKFGNAHLEECVEEMKKEMPLGYHLKVVERNFDREQKKNQFYLLCLIIGLIFFICSILFESLRQALSIILLIPLSFIGIFLIFYFFDFSFDQGGFTSFILTSGLVVNSLILIIDDFNRYCVEYPSRSKLDNFVAAYFSKITPILLSIISTLLGLIPFLIYGQSEIFWFSLAIGTIGGLSFSIVVFTFITPLFLAKE